MSNLNYKGKEIFVGIDVHLKSWDIRVMTKSVAHNQIHKADPSPLKLVNYLKKNYPEGNYNCVYEAGFSGYWIQEELEELGVNSIVVHAADVATTDKEKRFKDDKIDSTKLARSLRSGDLKGIFIPPKHQQVDRSVVRQRYRYASKERAVKNWIKSHLYFYGIKIEGIDQLSHWSNNYIIKLEQFADEKEDKVLSMDLKRLRIERQLVLTTLRQIRNLSKSEMYKQDFEILRSMPGVGMLTAMVFLTEIGDVTRFGTVDKLVAYIGLTPSCRNSGDKEYVGKISKRGNKIVRTSLVLAAWMSTRTPNKLSAYYEHCKTDLKKNSNQAIILVVKKMTKIMYKMLETKTKYTE